MSERILPGNTRPVSRYRLKERKADQGYNLGHRRSKHQSLVEMGARNIWENNSGQLMITA